MEILTRNQLHRNTYNNKIIAIYRRNNNIAIQLRTQLQPYSQHVLVCQHTIQCPWWQLYENIIYVLLQQLIAINVQVTHEISRDEKLYRYSYIASYVHTICICMDCIKAGIMVSQFKYVATYQACMGLICQHNIENYR